MPDTVNQGGIQDPPGHAKHTEPFPTAKPKQLDRVAMKGKDRVCPPREDRVALRKILIFCCKRITSRYEAWGKVYERYAKTRLT